ncbi:hypothetical protein [Alteromonas gracilis]|uniref:hypothetical protein n=1 Tax=Alteromonas gracilis TaxID=1479524 RepID=UPI0030CD00D9
MNYGLSQNTRSRNGTQLSALFFVLFVAIMVQSVSQARAVTFIHSHSSVSLSTLQSTADSASDTSRVSEPGEGCAHHNASSNSKGNSSSLKGVDANSIAPPDMTHMASTMDCCGEDCQCSAEHCFNSSGVALINPLFQSHVTKTRTAALQKPIGQRSRLTFKQFRPPKTQLTA